MYPDSSMMKKKREMQVSTIVVCPKGILSTYTAGTNFLEKTRRDFRQSQREVKKTLSPMAQTSKRESSRKAVRRCIQPSLSMLDCKLPTIEIY
jgi:uncharacterized membrane protein